MISLSGLSKSIFPKILLFSGAIILAVFFVFAEIAQAQTPGTSKYSPIFTDGLQPSGSDTITWSAGKYTTKRRNGQIITARGFEVCDTSTGGVIKCHMPSDYDAAGRKCYLLYHIPASSGSTQRVGLFFDEVDSAGTTINIQDIIIWY